MNKLTFDFTPDPKVLIALTQTPIKPIDALCELIDNSVDSFTNSLNKGVHIEHPTIWIEFPKKRDIEKNIGRLSIKDNGPGMSTEEAEKAIKAGFSGNNSLDTLGLFGMGFNISTGKMGIVTKFLTARECDDYCTRTTIDLEKINRSKSYQLEAEQDNKPITFVSGTKIEISNWWPNGHPNHGFVSKLIQYRVARIREEIGRRYATILREGKITILIDNEPCVAYEHCVWRQDRFVEKKNEKIQAQYYIDHVLSTKLRCTKCRAFIPEGENSRPSCGGVEFRSVEERVKGWVGIQRFDDTSKFGIDLIRNGRAIRIGEKNAFFEYVDEFQNTIKDYPIDSPYGRIVGEIHLDFVPVDFLKQDFQRSSDEWQRAMAYLRGESSLQPSQPGADNNHSVIYKLYQGYRRVRTPGTTDMYMGYWDTVEGKPKRFPNRDKETEFYQRFLNKEAGYYDDTEWWKVVEEASQAPAPPMIICPGCESQILAETEVCDICGTILKGKNCIDPDCGEWIPISATVCPHCQKSQVPKVEKPWTCLVCGATNPASVSICKQCKSEKGKTNPLGKEELKKNSLKDDFLSIEKLEVPLCNGDKSSAIRVTTYYTKSPLISPIIDKHLPLIVFKEVGGIDVFVDSAHPRFTTCGTNVIEAVASEIAAYLYDLRRDLSSNPAHSLSNLTWLIINKYWKDRIAFSPENITKSCQDLMATVKDRISATIDEALADRLFNELSDQQQTLFVKELQKHGISLSNVYQLKNGAFIRYVPDDFILQVYDAEPKLFFNGNLWKEPYDCDIEGMSKMVLNEIFNNTRMAYRNAIEAVIIYLETKPTDILNLKRISAILESFNSQLAEQ
ncbi:MAG: ATP-binding protein [Bacteroidales bacterium]|nr:ATP-binding protein [Bacteroidales bacterium]